jgi:hypothetical protein
MYAQNAAQARVVNEQRKILQAPQIAKYQQLACSSPKMYT